MAQERVLVVDDEEFNLILIEEFLAQENLNLELHTDPMLAWERLQAADGDYSLVVLDRMMPGLDGLELLRRMKDEPGLGNVPVIMQTAAASPEQVSEGLNAGAYYYLTKPYEPESLVSIVRAALEGAHGRQQLYSLSGLQEGGEQVVYDAEYRFCTLDDVARLVPALAALCPSPETVAPGLSDLMVNAIEHGNLGISYKEKARLKWEGAWEAEIERRLAQPQWRDRVATVRCACRPTEIVFTITDQGEGFDWRQYLAFDPERAFDPNGRGIAMARLLSFSRLEYQGRGNVVVAGVSV